MAFFDSETHPLARARSALAITDHSMLLLEALTDLSHATVLHMQLKGAGRLAIPVTSRPCDEMGLPVPPNIDTMVCSDR